MKKTSRIFVIALFVIFAFANVANTATALNIGASFPMLGRLLAESKSEEVHAGINLLVNTSETHAGLDKANYQGGYLNIPSNDKSKDACWVKNTDIADKGLFPEFNYLRVDPRLLGIEDKNVKEQTIVCEENNISFDPISRKIIIDLSTMPLGQHFLEYEVKQTQSRKSDRILFFTWVKHPKITDRSALIFTILDPSEYIDRVCDGYANQKLDGKTLLRLARAAYLDEKAGSMQLIKAEPSFNLTAAMAAMNVGTIGNNSASTSSTTYTTARIKFLDQTGNPITNAIQASIRNSQGELKADAVGSVATFDNCLSGEYQLTFFVYINEEWVKSGDFKIKAYPNMTDVTVTVGRRGGAN